MIIYPAIDIKEGKCVRLKQGRAEDSTIFFEEPREAADLWVSKGAAALHIVDLDGAFKGVSCNLDIIAQIKKDSNVFMQMGGGIRNKETITDIFNKGIDRVILGSAALNNIEFVRWSVESYGSKIAVSIDAVNKKAAYNGWTGVSELEVTEIMKSLIDAGVGTFIYTDISKDGMMKGPDIEGISKLMDEFDVNIIASGGVTTLDDVKVLSRLGVYGAIIGRALYDGNIKLEEAMEVSSCS